MEVMMMTGARCCLSLTPKALRVDILIAQGKSFDEAFAIADSEYSIDGMSLKSAPEAACNAANVCREERSHL
jgi:hypothetical protein